MNKAGWVTVFLASMLLADAAMARSTDPLNIAGTYTCQGFENPHGAYTAKLSLRLDLSASHFDQGFGAYRLRLDVHPNSTYSGAVAASGQTLGIQFSNDNPQAPTDRGIGVATMARVQDETGKFIIKLNKFYFLPDYKPDAKGTKSIGVWGTESCVKDAMD